MMRTALPGFMRTMVLALKFEEGRWCPVLRAMFMKGCVADEGDDVSQGDDSHVHVWKAVLLMKADVSQGDDGHVHGRLCC